MNHSDSMKGVLKPHYKHTCPGCAFLGSFMHDRDGVHDLYLCNGNIVAVRSNDPEFTFGILTFLFISAGCEHYKDSFPSLSYGYRLAREKGLI